MSERATVHVRQCRASYVLRAEGARACDASQRASVGVKLVKVGVDGGVVRLQSQILA